MTVSMRVMSAGDGKGSGQMEPGARKSEQDLAMALRADDIDAWGRPVDPALVGMYTHPLSASRTSLLAFDPESGTVTERATICEPERYWATQLSARPGMVEKSAAALSVSVAYCRFHSSYAATV